MRVFSQIIKYQPKKNVEFRFYAWLNLCISPCRSSVVITHLPPIVTIGPAEVEGLCSPTIFFAWVDFLRLQMTWIMYEFYHLKVTKRV